MTKPLLAQETEQPTDATTEAATTTTDTASQSTEETADETSAEDTTATDETAEQTSTETEDTTEETQAGAPDNYELSMPDSLPEDFQLDDATLDEFTGAARELDLTNEQAQSILDRVLPRMHASAEAQQTALHEQWLADTKADAEIGGAHLNTTKQNALKALDVFGTDALRSLLFDNALGSHPEILRMLSKVGASVSEDKTFVSGEAPGTTVDLTDEAAQARALYPHSPG